MASQVGSNRVLSGSFVFSPDRLAFVPLVRVEVKKSHYKMKPNASINENTGSMRKERFPVCSEDLSDASIGETSTEDCVIFSPDDEGHVHHLNTANITSSRHHDEFKNDATTHQDSPQALVRQENRAFRIVRSMLLVVLLLAAVGTTNISC
jgi:hypothetical protein